MRLIFVFAILGTFASCGKRPQPVDGTVFVVLNSGESIKLGLVPIHVYDASAIEALLRETNEATEKYLAHAEQEIAKLEHEIAKLETDVNDEAKRAAKRQLLETKLDRLTKALQDCIEKKKQVAPIPLDELPTRDEWLASDRKENPDRPDEERLRAFEILYGEGKLPEMVERWNSLEKQEASIETEGRKLAKAIKDLPPPKFFFGKAAQCEAAIRERRTDCDNYIASILSRLFGSLPQTDRLTKSDADGKFALRIPQNKKVCIVASASRIGGDSFEKYYWLVWIDPTADGNIPVMLSNDNLLPTPTRGSPLLSLPK